MWTRQRNPLQTKKGLLAWLARLESADEVIAESGVSFQLWRLYQHFWLVCLLFPGIAVASRPPVSWRMVMGVLALLFFAASYTWIMWPHPVKRGVQAASRPRLSFLLFVVLTLQVTAFSLFDDPSFLWLFIGVSAIAGMLFPMRTAGVVVVLLTLFPLAITTITHQGVEGIDWWWLIALMLLVRGLGLDMIGVVRMASAIRELHTTRRELARLQVQQERMRLARDLHDLLGQVLSMMTLKSELARHLVTEAPERCAQELAEIEQIARQTLREVREAVAGYRQPTLASELEGARQLLSAAGIDAHIEAGEQVLPRAVDAVLAWTIREGVTNIIRHSRAQQCHICLTQRNDTVEMEVLNDGCERQQVDNTTREGLGLAGLCERISALGGQMEAGPLLHVGKEHFHLQVKLPVKPQMEAHHLQEERA